MADETKTNRTKTTRIHTQTHTRKVLFTCTHWA